MTLTIRQNKHVKKSVNLFGFAVFGICLFAALPSFAGSVCETPDGFVFEMARKGPGIGGTGQKLADKGIGGTGKKINETGSGLGGTGRQMAATGAGLGGTGDKLELPQDAVLQVYGRITGFGSICVNGIEIEYKDDTPVEKEGEALSPDGLKIGQIVSLVAERHGGGLFEARAIAIEPSLPERGERPVALAAGVTHVSLQGHVAALPDRGAMMVGNVKVVLPERPQNIANNDRVLVFGEVDSAGAIHAEEVVVEHYDFEKPDEVEEREHETVDREDREEHEEHESVEVSEVDDVEISDDHEVEVPEHEELEHEVEAPEVEAPEIEAPEIEAPEVEVPEVETPEIEAPEIETPEVESPEVEVPEIEVPEIEEPDVEVPEIETPEIEEPEIEEFEID